MSPIISGILGICFDAFCSANRKKALNLSMLPKTLFKLFSHAIGVFVIIALVSIFGFEKGILHDPIYLGLSFLAVGVGVIVGLLDLHVFKHIRLSDALPYGNLDKLFIVIIGFIVFYGTESAASISTLIITIITIITVLVFTIDFQNIQFPPMIGVLFLVKFLGAIKVILVGYILLHYTSITFVSINLGFELLIFLLIAVLMQLPFKDTLSQSKGFYKHRVIGTLFGRGGYSLSLYVIESTGVITATLLGFFSVAFNIFAMRYILGDIPEKKQILLAGIVILLIGIGYSLK